MTFKTPLAPTIALYQQYDDDSLAIYANMGLVRRAKKALDEVTLQATEPLTFGMEGSTIVLSASGLTQASCNCSVHGACKHIVTCILWVQAHAKTLLATTASPQPETAPISDPQPESEATGNRSSTSKKPVTALDSLLNFDSLSVLKKLKKAERLLAYELFLTWSDNADLLNIDISEQKIRITTPLSDNPITYIAGSEFEGMISDIPHKYRLSAQVAMLAVLFGQYKKDWRWSEDILAEIGKNASNSKILYSLSPADIVLISQLQRHCHDILAQGLSHLSREPVTALHILNMQARTQHLPRLAGELRAIHGLLQRLLVGEVQTDEAALFGALARFYAYLFALSQINEQTSADNAKLLIGQVRRDYQDTMLDELIPLGAEWWQLPSGARGLTACFWEVTAQQLCEVTTARANSLDRTFDRYSVAQTGIWGSSLNFLLQHAIRLTHAKLGEAMTGNNTTLSPTSDSRFVSLADTKDISVADYQQKVTGITNWATLEQLLIADSAIRLHRPHYLLLHLAADNTAKTISELELNELNQSFDCWVTDSQGRQLQLSLPLSSAGNDSLRLRVDKLQALIRERTILSILVNVDYQSNLPRLIPSSVVLKRQKSDSIEVFSLDYDQVRTPKKGLYELLANRIQRLYDKRHLNVTPTRSTSEQLLGLIQTRLDYYASSGKSAFDPQDSEQLQTYFEQCEALGLTLLSRYGKQGMTQLVTGEITMPHFLLQSRLLLDVVQQMAVRLPIH